MPYRSRYEDQDDARIADQIRRLANARIALKAEEQHFADEKGSEWRIQGVEHKIKIYEAPVLKGDGQDMTVVYLANNLVGIDSFRVFLSRNRIRAIANQGRSK